MNRFRALVTTTLLAAAPALLACSSSDLGSGQGHDVPTVEESDTHADNLPCTITRLRAQEAACAAQNVDAGTCDTQCLGVDVYCKLIIGNPGTSTPCAGNSYDCHLHTCDGFGSCVESGTRLDDGTKCITDPFCLTYGSTCTSGVCGAPKCKFTRECDVRSGDSCTAKCASLPSCEWTMAP